MKRGSAPLRVRVAYEPNRLSSHCLVKVYEQLGPTIARAVSKRHEAAEQVVARVKPAATSGGES